MVIIQHHQLQILVFNIYGWTGGDTHNEAAQKTNQLCEAIFKELEETPRMPYLIVGDLNASLGTLAAVQEELDKGRIQDLGTISEALEETQGPTPVSHTTVTKVSGETTS